MLYNVHACSNKFGRDLFLIIMEVVHKIVSLKYGDNPIMYINKKKTINDINVSDLRLTLGDVIFIEMVQNCMVISLSLSTYVLS